MVPEPSVSVIIPVYNGRHHLARCLGALESSSYANFEIIVVDDASTDDSAAIAGESGATVLSMPRQSGPAAARNHGAQHATKAVLLFVDADVVVRTDTVARVAARFSEAPEMSALFGSYDDTPAELNFFSQYRNLFHHFHHQQSTSAATTFWSGCGAIRREIFASLGGFDETTYARPSIEDIELGCRMHQRGHAIHLDGTIQVKHLKRWDLVSIVRTDIFSRAIPWSRLIVSSKHLPDQLNLRWVYRASALVVALLCALPLVPILDVGVAGIFGNREVVALAVGLLLIFGVLNRRLYLFFFQKRGFGFMLRASLCHGLYYLYSGTAFVGCWLEHQLARARA